MIGRIKNIRRTAYNRFSKSQAYNALKRITLLRRMKLMLGTLIWRTAPYNFPLHGDPIAIRLFEMLVKEGKIKAIVETGTFRGYTTSLLAKKFPNIPIHTCEINDYNFKKAKENLKVFKNVSVYHNTSPKFLAQLIKDRIISDRVLFYLDAHWLDEWPLEEEMQIISSKIKSAFIVIDDFKVPGDDRFAFDKYKDKECSLDMVNPNIIKPNSYQNLFPNYGEEVYRKDIAHPNLVGYVIIFQNFFKEFKKLNQTDFVRRFFKDRTDLMKKNRSKIH
ncbi:MAG: hypothetical protein AABW82_00735 [Nanoarchaeota archaeon]